MTDIASLAHVQQALSPLHVRAYFDEELFAREQETIFKQSAIYVGHERRAPATGAACRTRKAAACWCATPAASS